MATKEDVPRFVKELIAAEVKDEGYVELSAAEITDHLSFSDDLGLDNLAVMSIVMALEIRLGIEIPDDILSQNFHGETVGDLINIVIGCMTKAGKS